MLLSDDTQDCLDPADIFYDAVPVLQEGEGDVYYPPDDEDDAEGDLCSLNVDEAAVPSCKNAVVSIALFITLLRTSIFVATFYFSFRQNLLSLSGLLIWF